MKKKRIPLFSGYRKRGEEAKRKEVQQTIIKGLNKTMAQQRARVMNAARKKEAEKPEPAAAEEKTEE